MNLSDGETRWITVRFEVSPGGRPGQRDTVYSKRFPARLEQAAEPSLVKVTIDAEIVEQNLLRGQRPMPGTFSDFVWVFDAPTGEVLSAGFRGTLVRRVGWGLISVDVETEIVVDMSTLEQAGYEMPRRLFANTVFPYCASEQPASDCTLVTPSAYEPRSGYVNAVGDLVVHSKVATLHTFSPLGEAVFSELPELEQWPEVDLRLTRPAPSIEPDAPKHGTALVGDAGMPLEY